MDAGRLAPREGCPTAPLVGSARGATRTYSNGKQQQQHGPDMRYVEREGERFGEPRG